MQLSVIFITLVLIHLAGVAHAEAFESDLISVEVEGTGRDVVLVPGLASSADVWDGTVKSLKEHYRFHRVSIAGFAGNPPADTMPDPYLPALRDDLERYLSESGLSKPTMVGHSMGGLLTLMVASDAPDRLGRAIVVDAFPFLGLLYNPQSTSDEVSPIAQQMAEEFRAMDAAIFEVRVRHSARNLTLSQDRIEQIVTWAKNSDRRTYARLMQEVMTYDARPELLDVSAPTFVIVAHDSSMLLTREGLMNRFRSAYERLEKVRFQTIDNSYHFLMWDRPEAFVETLEQAL